MRNPIAHFMKIAACVLLWTAASFAGQQAAKPAAEGDQAKSIMAASKPNDLVAKVVNNELNARDEATFMYRDWRQTPEGSKTKEMVETKDGVVARLIATNDKPLTPEQKNAENARLQNLLSHPELQQQKKKEQQQDEDRVKKMFKELPRAFVYEYAGVEEGASGEEIKLTFKPNPNYNPPSRETSVYKAMSGAMWVSVSDMRLAKIEATLFRTVDFGWGILGHLDKGGHFIVAQSRIGPDRWEATDMNIQFTGKILLFKTINMRQVEKLTEFHRVPEGLTLAQGVELLNKNGEQVAENTNGK